MPSVFLDSNVLVYAATTKASEPRKWKRAIDVMQANDFGLSGHVLAEFVSVVRRKARPPLSDDELDGWLNRLGVLEIAPVDAGLVRRGLALSRHYKVAYYDGAILAAAERLGCGTVLSEDMADGRTYGSVTVRNPFKET